MRKVYVLFLFLCFPIVAFCEMPNDFPNEPSGFRGIEWGTGLSTVNEMKKVLTDKDDPDLAIYKRASDLLILGDAKLKSIVYRGWKDRFDRAMLLFEGYSNWEKTKAVLFARFGPGIEHRYKKNYFTWFGSKTTIELDYNEFSNEGSVRFFSKRMGDEMNEYVKNKAEKDVSKGF